MPKRDRKYMAARRDEIVDAALALMMREGAAALSTPALCREAGISTGALYTHFKSKDDVLAAIAERAVRGRRDDYDFHDASEMRERLTHLASVCIQPTETAKMRADLEIFLAGPNDERIASVFRDYVDGRDLVRGVARLSRVGELKNDLDPLAAATAINALLTGARVLALMGARETTPFGQAMDLLLAAMERPTKK